MPDTTEPAEITAAVTLALAKDRAALNRLEAYVRQRTLETFAAERDPASLQATEGDAASLVDVADSAAEEAFRQVKVGLALMQQGGTTIGRIIERAIEKTRGEFRSFEQQRSELEEQVRAGLNRLLGHEPPPLVVELADGVWRRLWKDRSNPEPLATRAMDVAEQSAKLALLMVRVNRDESWAYDDLIAQLKPKVKQMVARMYPHAAAREDIVQQVWMTLIRLRLRPELAASFGGLLRRIVTHKVIDWTRRDQKALPQPAEAPAPSPSRLHVFDNLLEALIRNEPPHRAVVFAFRHLLGYMPREIASKYRNHSLRALTDEFLSEYSGHVIPHDRLLEICAPLLDALPRPLDEVLTEPTMRKKYEGLLAYECGETLLANYETTTLDRDMTKWCNVVKERLCRWAETAGLLNV